METTSLPPSGYGDGGKKGLGDVQTGPCVVWSIQPVEPAVQRGRPTGCHLFLDVGMVAQPNFSGAKKEYEVGNPTGQGDELYGNQQFASPKVVSWGAEREGDVKGEYGVVYEDAPVDEGYAVVEVSSVREDKEGLGIPDCYLSDRGDPIGQLVRRKKEQHAEHRTRGKERAIALIPNFPQGIPDGPDLEASFLGLWFRVNWLALFRRGHIGCLTSE